MRRHNKACVISRSITLTLEEVYGALAFYLGHRDEIDAYLQRSEASLMISAAVHVPPIRCSTASSTKRVSA